MASGEKVGLVLFGGIVLGVWIYGLLFGFPDWNNFEVTRWFFWGLIGLMVAAGVYAARATDDTPRLIIISLIGVVTSIIILGATLQENLYVLATLATIIGGGMILGAAPLPNEGSDSAAGTPPAQ